MAWIHQTTTRLHRVSHLTVCYYNVLLQRCPPALPLALRQPQLFPTLSRPQGGIATRLSKRSTGASTRAFMRISLRILRNGAPVSIRACVIELVATKSGVSASTWSSILRHRGLLPCSNAHSIAAPNRWHPTIPLILPFYNLVKAALFRVGPESCHWEYRGSNT